VLPMGVPAKASTMLSISSCRLLPRSPPTLENDTARLDEFEERWERVFVFKRSNGIKKTNCEPTPGFESTRNWPRSWPIMCATTANPRPSEGKCYSRFHQASGTTLHTESCRTVILITLVGVLNLLQLAEYFLELGTFDATASISDHHLDDDL